MPCLFFGDTESGSLRPLSQGLCFQAEDVVADGNRLEITGVCFWYEQGLKDYTIILQSTHTGKQYPMRTKCRISRSDVSAYFKRDNIQAGFEASYQDLQAGEEYEFVLDFGILRSISTGVYLTVEQPFNDSYTK